MWQSKLPKLEYRRLAYLRNYMYKRKEDQSYLDNGMVVTRRGDAVSVFEKSVLYRGAKEWNTLAVELRNIPTLIEGFKWIQRQWLLSTLRRPAI